MGTTNPNSASAASGTNTAISDATPLIGLVKIGKLEFLKEFFGTTCFG